MNVNHNARSGSILGIFFSIFFNINVCCVFSLESPHGGDSNEYTQYTLFNIKKSPEIIPKLQLWDFFSRTQERLRNSRGKRAISVRAIEVLLYFDSSLA